MVGRHQDSASNCINKAYAGITGISRRAAEDAYRESSASIRSVGPGTDACRR